MTLSILLQERLESTGDKSTSRNKLIMRQICLHTVNDNQCPLKVGFFMGAAARYWNLVINRGVLSRSQRFTSVGTFATLLNPEFFEDGAITG